MDGFDDSSRGTPKSPQSEFIGAFFGEKRQSAPPIALSEHLQCQWIFMWLDAL